MKTLDLTTAAISALASRPDHGEAGPVSAVLETLGIDLAPTLRSGLSMAAVGTDPEGETASLGRFLIQGELGVGGMGRVLEARDPELRRSVAIKMIIDPKKVTSAQLARFVAEAQITSQLEHPNIVPVYDMGLTPNGDIYFVMKKVEGRSLRAVLSALKEGGEATAAEWTRTKLLHAFIQICNAVAYAHDRGVLHRDLKPDNIMLGAFGEVLLVDWGVARLMGDTTESLSTDGIERVEVARTQDGAAIGTRGYMSPEQALGRLHELDARSDVWSLGAMLYELLTLASAYEASSLYALVYASVTGPPLDPRERAPERRIPTEVAEVCLRALATEREDRFASAGDLAAALEAFLEGSKRREAALRHVAEAEAAWQRYGALATEREELVARESALGLAVEPWAPLDEKAELRSVRRRVTAIGPERVARFSDVLTLCDKALSQDPGNADARALLATAHYARFEEAEADHDEESRLFHEARVVQYDDGRYAPLLRGTGALSLRTDPPGADVICERYDQEADLVWPLVEQQILGTTPLQDVPLEQGSYRLILRLPGRRDTRYPVVIRRGQRWDSGPQPVPLYGDAERAWGASEPPWPRPPDSGQEPADPVPHLAFVYVPAGPTQVGGDEHAQDAEPRAEVHVDGFFIAVFPVTTAEYADFLTALHARDPEQAWSRVPRQSSGLKTGGGQYWERPAPGDRYVVPERDRDGDRWDPLWPVSAVSWMDAQAYVAWRSERDGLPWGLPTERQWSKAARGVDGRLYPWGNGFDAMLCKMRDSRPNRPLPEPVGSFPLDVSPYGVADMAGSARQWCGDEAYRGDPTRRPIRGGSWNTNAIICRAAYRHGIEPWNVFTNIGFRIARPALPRSD